MALPGKAAVSMTEVRIHTEFIKLDQMLKLEGIAGTGAEARFMIEEIDILVNGEVEKRRGKKLRPGDKVVVNGEEYAILAE